MTGHDDTTINNVVVLNNIIFIPQVVKTPVVENKKAKINFSVFWWLPYRPLYRRL